MSTKDYEKKSEAKRGINQQIEEHGLSLISHLRSMNYGEVNPLIDKAPDTKIYVCLKNCSDNEILINFLKGRKMEGPVGVWFELDPKQYESAVSTSKLLKRWPKKKTKKIRNGSQ